MEFNNKKNVISLQNEVVFFRMSACSITENIMHRFLKWNFGKRTSNKELDFGVIYDAVLWPCPSDHL